MLRPLLALVFLALLPISGTAAPVSSAAMRAGLQSDVSQYLAARANAERISAVSLSVYIPGEASNINVTAGRTRYGRGGARITPATLYQIGSNTKSFTAAAILQLEAEGKLDINDTVGKWLPQYPAWKNVSIRRLLNMTSDIPTYDDVSSMLAAYAAKPHKYWSPQELVGVVYPKLRPNAGWLYSNTAYIMSGMIIERASGHSYTSEIRRRFLNNPAIGLKSTYYESHVYPASITDRMTSGYFFSTDPDNAALAPLLGKDMRTLSLSWAQAAGGIVSTPEDVTRWCRALYGNALLAPKQRAELRELVSQTDARPLKMTTAKEPRGFGLGVGEMYNPKMGRVWFYEGETLGYRMTYVYFPDSGVTFAAGINSQPTKSQDHVGQLMTAVYNTLHAAGKV